MTLTINPADLWGFAFALLLLVAIPLWAINRRTQRLEYMLDEVKMHLGLQGRALTEPSEAVRALALDPKTKIEAIRAYRKQSGAGLREAKDAVERLARQGPGPTL